MCAHTQKIVYFKLPLITFIKYRKKQLHFYIYYLINILGFPGGSDGKESAHSTGDLDLISGLGRSSVEGNGYLLQYSCLEKSMDRRAWLARVHGVAKSWTQLSN